MTNAIEVKGLCKDYGDFKLDHVDLVVPGGSILGLIGENGAGKSTTIKCLLGLVRPNSGTMTLLGREPEQAKQDIGVVLDETNFHEMLKAPQVENIMSKLYTGWDKSLFEHYMKKFGLPENKKVKEFSRGMKMKLGIAAALSHHPRLLILDEATGGLDPVVRNEILDEFLAFIQDEEHGILISSHITSDLEKVADYVTYLHKGKVTVSGAKDELLESFGRLACTRQELAQVEPEYLVGTRQSQFSCEALVRDRRAFSRRYPQFQLDPVTLEEIMVFTVRGDEA